MIETHQLCKTVQGHSGELRILNNINLHIDAGETVAVIGPSGSGKSTLLGLLAGLDAPTSGRVVIDGDDLSAMDEDQRAHLRNQKVGFVFQSFQLLPSLSALENVMLPLEIKGVGNAQQLAQEFLEKVGLAQRAHHYPRQLSGGEQQRVAIARAFACRPRLLFADEPTGNLDTKTGGRIIDLLFELNQQSDTTLVLVTHEQRLAQRCQRRILLEGGELIEDSQDRDEEILRERRQC